MPETLTKSISTVYLDQLRKFAGKLGEFNADLVVFDSDLNCLFDHNQDRAQSEHHQLVQYAEIALQQESSKVQTLGANNEILAMRLTENEQVSGVILVEIKKQNGSNLQNDYLAEIITLFVDKLKLTSNANRQLEMVSTELAQTYEELVLLYNLSTNMKVTQSNATYLQIACDQLTQLVSVEGIAIYLEKTVEKETKMVLTAGAGVVVIDNLMVDILQNHLAEELRKGKEALLDSNAHSPFKYSWPDIIKSIIAVPLYGKDNMIGLMVATNIMNKKDFDSIDVKLFNSVANQCAVFIENGRLFTDLKELFIGSLKALTNSIDAKDQYTRGHSERVAFISRWVAEQLAAYKPINEETIHCIYLAGLLHDIGKIGITETVLRKRGKLEDDEHDRIKAHPRIGASILSDIKQMDNIVPGVLYHHERIDGKGYPDGLSGNQIPLIAKIISLADSFDAMTSKRVYREAMSITRALNEIEKGIGTQFDEEIAKVFIQSDVRKLWSIIQDGFIESWDYSNFSEYGTVAVGTLIR